MKGNLIDDGHTSHEIEHGTVGKTYFIPLEPILSENNEPYLPIYCVFPKGQSDSISENSALVRPFRKILRNGKPIGKIVFIFYQEKNEYFVLGSLAYSGKRLIFFPGLIDRRLVVAPDGSKPLDMGSVFNIDHYSLEENWRTWHTKLEENKKYSKMNTKKINDSLFLWFVMGVQSISNLESMPKTQEIHLKGSHLADLKRRYKIIMESRDNAQFPVTKIDDDAIEPYYLNFEFFVSTKQYKELKDFPDVIVYDLRNTSAQVSDPRADILVRNHQVKLATFEGFVWIRVSKINGNLPYHSIITEVR